MVHLTEREIEVLNFLIQGKSNNEISKELFVTCHTIKAHLDSIYRKLDVHNRVQACMAYVNLQEKYQ